MRDGPRIVVVGTSGSGKTTLARELARRLGRHHVELDALHWGPGWTPRADFAARTERAVAAEAWVADGNYGAVRDLVWGRATALVWLNYPFPLVFGRAVRRTVRRAATRERLYAGNRETFRRSFLGRDSILLWVLRTWHRRRRQYPRLLRDPRYAHLRVLELRSPAEADEVLHSLASASPRRGT